MVQSWAVNWDDDPGKRPPVVRIVHAPAQGLLELWVLGEREFGVFGHWDDVAKRNRPCCDPYGCICETRAVPTWWKCYLPVQFAVGRKLGMAELSADAWRGAYGVKLREARETLRGLKLTLKRDPPIKQGKIVAQFHEPSVSMMDSLPPPFDVKAELQKVWFSRL